MIQDGRGFYGEIMLLAELVTFLRTPCLGPTRKFSGSHARA